MADMPTDFWGGWITVLTVVSVLGLIWLIVSIYFSKDRNEDLNSPVWDKTLSEGPRAAPMWWFWMMLFAMVFSVVYLMLYPGLGSFSGVLKWSQSGRLDESLASYNEKFQQVRENVAQSPISKLQNDPLVMNSAKRIYSQNCAVCHGPNGTGQAFTFPNLKDDDWQWGGSDTEIEHTVRHGRQAVMVGWQNVLGDEGVLQVVNYVKSLSTNADSAAINEGRQLFQQYCVACHGTTGEGNTALGAPNLTDDVWLYGNSDTALRHTISLGRNGIMPAFNKRLDDAQIRMLVAWLTH